MPATVPAATGPRVAVTGAGGFLGRRIALALAAGGLRVTALGRTAPTGFPPGVATAAWDGRRPPPDGLEVDAVVDCAAAIPARVPDPDRLLASTAAVSHLRRAPRPHQRGAGQRRSNDARDLLGVA